MPVPASKLSSQTVVYWVRSRVAAMIRLPALLGRRVGPGRRGKSRLWEIELPRNTTLWLRCRTRLACGFPGDLGFVPHSYVKHRKVIAPCWHTICRIQPTRAIAEAVILRSRFSFEFRMKTVAMAGIADAPKRKATSAAWMPTVRRDVVAGCAGRFGARTGSRRRRMPAGRPGGAAAGQEPLRQPRRDAGIGFGRGRRAVERPATVTAQATARGNPPSPRRGHRPAAAPPGGSLRQRGSGPGPPWAPGSGQSA